MKEYLEKKPNDFVGAIKLIPFKIRKMFVHAYQIYLWNKVVKDTEDETFWGERFSWWSKQVMDKVSTTVASVKLMLPNSGKCTTTRIASLMMTNDLTRMASSSMYSNPHLKNIDENYKTFDVLKNNFNNSCVLFYHLIQA